MESKQLLFSVTKDDFDWHYVRGSGAGGQKRNKTSSACRCVHRASGAMGFSQDGRSQSHNRQAAFERCVSTREFQQWLKINTAAIMQGYRDIDTKVNHMMAEENLKIEYYEPKNRI